MRVLYLTMNPNRESTTVPTEGWLRVLRPKGLEPIVVSNTAGAFLAWTRAEGIPSYEVPLPFPEKLRPWRFLRSLAKLVALGRRHRVQLVHSNEQDVYPIAQYAARLLGVPVVVSVHFTMAADFARWAFHGARNPDRLLFVSASNLEACRPGVNDVVPASKWRVLHNGLDMNRYGMNPARGLEFRAKHALADSCLIGAACALRPRKQIEHLIEAVGGLRTPSVRLVLAGAAVPGDEDYAAGLLRRGRELLGERFVHVGHQTDLRPFYNALDLFANTSKEEAFGISVLEALASGCPVVGYPSLSVAEVVEPLGGEIVAQDDRLALGRALDRWLERPDAGARLRARQQAQRFRIESLSDQLWLEYHALSLQGARPQRTRRTAA